MRAVPAAITAARQSESSRLCQIWEVTRTDGTILRFTEHDRDLIVSGNTYLSTASFDPSSIKANADMAVGDMDVRGAFSVGEVTAADVLAGKYQGASFWVGEVLWDAPEEGVDILKFGWLGRCKELGGQFTFELLGPGMMLQHTIGEIYSPTCRATFGDARCKVDLESVQITVTVTAVTSRREFAVSGLSTPVADYWSLGLAQWLTGANAGISMEVQTSDVDDVALLLAMPFDIAIGDTLRLTAGCDHTLAMCRDRFNNVLNFRGEPHVPVSDDLIRGPGADVARATGGSAVDVSPPPGPPAPLEPSSTVPAGQSAGIWALTFEDHFDSSTLDAAKWSTPIWYGDQAVTEPGPNVTNSNNTVVNYDVNAGNNSCLRIWPALQSGKYFYRTIHTDSMGLSSASGAKFRQKYGYFEARMKLPRGRGCWPAFWLFGHYGIDGTKPVRPEIDIMEAYSGGYDSVNGASPGWADSNLHPTTHSVTFWTDSGNENDRTKYGPVMEETTDLSAAFHVYGLTWEPGGVMTWFLDGVQLGSHTFSSGDALDTYALAIYLDLWFGSASGYASESETPVGSSNSFEIDYVRAWAQA